MIEAEKSKQKTLFNEMIKAIKTEMKKALQKTKISSKQDISWYSIGRICEVMELTEDGFNKRRKRLIKERLIPLFFL